MMKKAFLFLNIVLLLPLFAKTSAVDIVTAARNQIGAEDAAGHAVGVEQLQIGHFFTDTAELDGLAHHALLLSSAAKTEK